MASPHLSSLGSRNLPRREFEQMLAGLVADPALVWR
jgi:Leu/Phe-tRNA-protein transferase